MSPRAGMEKLRLAGRLIAPENTLRYLRFLDDFPAFALNSFWDDTLSRFNNDRRYAVQTAAKIIERCIVMASDPGDLVLDPTCGGGTMAYCAEKWGRRWITMDTSRVALMLTRERLLSARFPYFVLADTQDGRLQDARLSGFPTPTD
ncbi:MAG: site-specific DNA-methyltransferase, partial [Candidatus Eremiobacteraeota bacterium]|nr:site-specific DNA-methyltransferase [Candidatus Eremiobacteraeota bacterium]